tara:strand:+ start:894 stop:1112 length:219 start_codon:yes stop_codon:yes gene_type:complete
MRAMDTVVNDRQHIQAKTLVLGGVDDYPTFAEEALQAADAFPNGGSLSHPRRGTQSPRGSVRCSERPVDSIS